jgi:hypothetical protein
VMAALALGGCTSSATTASGASAGAGSAQTMLVGGSTPSADLERGWPRAQDRALTASKARSMPLRMCGQPLPMPE